MLCYLPSRWKLNSDDQSTFHLLSLSFFSFKEISQYGDGRRRSLSVQEGSTVLLECPLPHSVPSALPRLKVRGERREESKGSFDAGERV